MDPDKRVGQGPIHGRESVIQFFTDRAEVFGGLRMELERFWETNDQVLAFVRVSGHGGASGAAFDIRIAHLWTLRERRRLPRPLAPAQINKTLKRLSQILEVAEEYDHIARNPARGKRRRVKAPVPRRTWVEPEQLPSLLNAADRYLRPVLATLTGAGLRNGEAVALDVPDLNLATATLTVGRAKPDAGSWREVDLPSGVVEALSEWRAHHAASSGPLFVTRKGRRQPATGIAQKFKRAIRDANGRLAELGIEAISERVTPHSLRRTYASLRFALGDDPIYVAEQMGHADAGRLAATIYAKAVKRRSKLQGAHLAEFEKALEWAALPTTERALMGTSARFGGDELREQHSNLA